MAQCQKRLMVLHSVLLKGYCSIIGVTADSALKSIVQRNYSSGCTVRRSGDIWNISYKFSPPGQFSTQTSLPKLCWEGSSRTILLEKLETHLTDHRVDEAWETFNDFKRLYGFPEKSILNRLITDLLYSTDSRWLHKAYGLAFSMSKEKSVLLGLDLLTKLCLSLSRAQMSIQASMVVRLMLERKSLPAMDILQVVVLHMVKTETGTILASNILIEICNCFHQLKMNKAHSQKLTKPDTVIFNLVLEACARFGSSLKGLQIIEMMAEIGVVADAHTINIIARIHELNFMRDELKKFKKHIDLVSAPLACHYRQFYNSLLSLHFIFNDIDAASALILDFNRCRKSNLVQEGKNETCAVPIGSAHLRMGLKLHILPELLEKDSVLKVEGDENLVMNKNGKLSPSNKAVAKLFRGYKSQGRINEFSKLLGSIQNMLGSSSDANLCSDVIDACIHIGWLETAHDILDDLASEGIPKVKDSYMSLLAAYYREEMFNEGAALYNQLQKAGFPMDVSNTKKDISIRRLDLVESLIQDMEEEAKLVPTPINELNSSIYFFMKAKMIEDALKTYGRIQDMKIQPTVLTFANLVYGYSSLGMYREITKLWGDIKRNMNKDDGKSMAYRDLYEALLLNFIRGGYFERVMEVVAFMMEKGMYLDKWNYKSEFLKFHKDLYKNLKTSDHRNEVRTQRLEHVRMFKKWVGIARR
ncbi:hypothetical protein M9H77_32989 [Catharanthus roseus]|uniref:Uncharacterized protein n=1 Tax=Catharanthus roseus TaxID=4058 RepID=A0ACC0A779_CATRO|nr:hypothetical protein M9H77_32989 [Catharanthus roseus]